MTRIARQALERRLERARRLAMEPTDPRSQERLAQVIEALEFLIQDGSIELRLREEARHNHYTGII